jgi:hypothetical protein
MAIGKLTVSGTRTANDAGPETVSLTISYGAVSGFPKSVGLTCTDKIKNKPVPTKKYQLPPSNSPGDYLLSQLVFSGGGSLTGTFGKGGHSDYILEKLQ